MLCAARMSDHAIRFGQNALANSPYAELIVLHVVPRYPMRYFEGGANLLNDEVIYIEKLRAASDKRYMMR